MSPGASNTRSGDPVVVSSETPDPRLGHAEPGALHGVVQQTDTTLPAKPVEHLARIIGSLQPIAASTGTFSDVRGVQITLTLAVHEMEAASFLASKRTP